MVFYGKKNTISQSSHENYVSIQEEITRELGSRNYPAKEKSISTIIHSTGDICLKAILAVIEIPESFRRSSIYPYYQMDRQAFREDMQQYTKAFS